MSACSGYASRVTGVNTHTHTYTQTNEQTNSLYPVMLLAQPSELKYSS